MRKMNHVYGAFAVGALAAGSVNAQTPSQPHNDMVVALAGGSLATLTLNGQSGVAVLDSGTLGMELDGDSTCASTPTVGCQAQVVGLRLTARDIRGLQITVNGDIDTVDLIGPNTILTGSTSMLHNGSGFPLPAAGTVSVIAHGFGNVGGTDLNGRMLIGSSTMPGGLIVRYNLLPSEIMALDGSVPIALDIAGNTLNGRLSFLAAAATPFINTPPLAFAGQDQVVACGATVTLDASQTIDLENNITAYRWFAANGTLLASTAVAQVALPPGSQTIRLEVEDSGHAIGRDFVQIAVQPNSPPTLSVPGDVVAQTCGPVDIGQATGTTTCGNVTVTNDAPATFFAGLTTVTWTARNIAGLTATSTQRVFVELGNNPACCPPGSTVILGTSNNDVLIGTSGRDCILGFGGQDNIDGRGGDDIISGGDGDDTINGGDGNDVVSGGPGQDKIFGGAGNDFLAGDDGDDQLDGGDGDDFLTGGQGQDVLHGGAGADRVLGGTGDDQLFGDDGDDLLDGGPDHNQCTGGAGFDTILQCTALDVPESTGTPAFPGTPGYNTCNCKPNKCNDCSSQVAQCQATTGCAQIIECVQATSSCNLPHECSALCESGRSSQAITLARQLASCFGGC